MTLPTLAVVSGPPGTGKTTLAHALAHQLGCPAIIRDEIKQGMVLATPGFSPTPEDPLNMPTLTAFFDVIGVLLRSRVTVVAEAAFQDRLWRPNLEQLADLAHIRVIRCVTSAAVAQDRVARRAESTSHRAAHADQELLDSLRTGQYSLDSFVHISLDVPTLEVNTSVGYLPTLPDIAAFTAPQTNHAGLISDENYPAGP